VRAIRKPLLAALVLASCICAFAAPMTSLHVVDTAGDGISAGSDLISVDLQHDTRQVSITLKTAAEFSAPNTQLLLDTDSDSKTGFQDVAGGFDLLIEGTVVYRFAGSDQTAWNWTRVAEVSRKSAADSVTLRLDRPLLGPTDTGLMVRTISADYQEIDRVPDQGLMTITALAQELSKPQPAAQIKDASGDAKDQDRDLTELRISQSQGQLRIELKTTGTGTFDQTLILFDTDSNPKTGYRSPNIVGYGFDYLLTGGQVHSFVGAEQDAWAWSIAGAAQVHSKPREFSATFAANLLKAQRVDVAVLMMSSDWQSVIDAAPDHGAVPITIIPAGQKPADKISMAAPRANRSKLSRQRVAEANNFYCYYGSGRVAELSHYDIVIAHAPQMAAEDIARLKQLGVVVVGYLTVGEDEKLRRANGTGPDGQASWYFDDDDDGKPDQNSIWKSYYANANDPAWREDRVAEARRLIDSDGYDGIFLDTLDTASAFPTSKPGMIRLVRELREALPEAPIVLNQGYPLLPDLAPLSDAIMLESFTATYDFRTKQYVMHSPASLDWSRGVAQRILKPVLDQHPLRVLVLDYALPQDRERIQIAADRAATFGFLFAAGPITLDQVYVTDMIGKPDPKWLRKQATPDALKHTLSETKLGWPKGTVLMPSGCHSGYTVRPLVNPETDRSSVHWADAAWASAEDGEDAWLEIQLPTPLSGGALRVQFATDSGRLHASRAYRVEIRRKGEWKLVEAVQDNIAAVRTHRLPEEAFDGIRLYQAVGDGSQLRPDLMWLEQVAWAGH
jgi:hypothetical protein